MGKIIRNGVEYSGATEDATAVNYDNSLSGLNAQTVQEGIDELTESLGGLGNIIFLGDQTKSCPADTNYTFTFELPTKDTYLVWSYMNSLDFWYKNVEYSFDGLSLFSTSGFGCGCQTMKFVSNAETLTLNVYQRHTEAVNIRVRAYAVKLNV